MDYNSLDLAVLDLAVLALACFTTQFGITIFCW